MVLVVSEMDDGSLMYWLELYGMDRVGRILTTVAGSILCKYEELMSCLGPNWLPEMDCLDLGFPIGIACLATG